MFVISGATGRVGSAVAAGLLEAGHPVRVIVRRVTAAQDWQDRGAQAAVVDLRDSDGLAAALEDATAFFAMMPFDLATDDLPAYEQEVVASVAAAVQASGVAHTVMLSSGGADLPEGTGPIVGLHRMEQALGQTGTTLTALRPGHFQEKVGDVLEPARHEGVYPVFSSTADAPLPMNATRDIAVVAVQELLAGPRGSEVVDIVGPSYTEREVAVALGRALGHDLQVVTIPEPGWAGALQDAGFAPNIAASLSELYQADEEGRLGPRGDRSVQVSTDLAATLQGMLAGVNA
ncbi:NAD(P)H-binding protein [Citricoccus parietis]|uniref:NAD(P)H-binding protein n=2 Tax=Citricoccus parietis TaxID=592307 RepID=A0ABV6F417_9MICC